MKRREVAEHEHWSLSASGLQVHCDQQPHAPVPHRPQHGELPHMEPGGQVPATAMRKVANTCRKGLIKEPDYSHHGPFSQRHHAYLGLSQSVSEQLTLSAWLCQMFFLDKFLKAVLSKHLFQNTYFKDTVWFPPLLAKLVVFCQLSQRHRTELQCSCERTPQAAHLSLSD